MQRLNAAYELLKLRCTNNEVLNYYNTLKEKLHVFKSKTIYLPDTLEYKYAKSIDELLAVFTFSPDKTTVYSAFEHLLELIINLFDDYKKEVCKNIPEFFLNKFNNLSEVCSFDEYVLKVNKVMNNYDEIDKTLNKTLEEILASFTEKIDAKLLDELFEIKNDVIKDIADKKINLEDGKNKYHYLVIEKLKKEKS